MTIDKFYADLCARGYLPELEPGPLLRLVVDYARCERAILNTVAETAIEGIFLEVVRSPDDLAHELESRPGLHPHSLISPHNKLAVEVSVLVFAASLTRERPPPRWLFVDVFPGKAIHRLLRTIAEPKSLGRWLHDQASGVRHCAALDDCTRSYLRSQWPSRSTCGVLVELLDTPLTLGESSDQLLGERLRMIRILRALVEGGLSGLHGSYMLATADSAESWCHARGRGRCGTMRQLGSDVAEPILRSRGYQDSLPSYSNRRPLHDARRRTLNDHVWSARSHYSDDFQVLLRELDRLVCGR